MVNLRFAVHKAVLVCTAFYPVFLFLRHHGTADDRDSDVGGHMQDTVRVVWNQPSWYYPQEFWGGFIPTFQHIVATAKVAGKAVFLFIFPIAAFNEE